MVLGLGWGLFLHIKEEVTRMNKKVLKCTVIVLLLFLSIPTVVEAADFWRGHSDVLQVEQDLTTLDKMLTDKGAVISTQKSEIEKLTRANSQLTTENTNLKNENKTLTEKNTQLNTKAASMDKVLSTMTTFFGKTVTTNNYASYMDQFLQYAKRGRLLWPWTYDSIQQQSMRVTSLEQEASTLQAENELLEQELIEAKETLEEQSTVQPEPEIEPTIPEEPIT